MILTKAHIDTARGPRGTWSAKQVRMAHGLVGQRYGWSKRLIGLDINPAYWAIFLLARPGSKKKPKQRPKKKNFYRSKAWRELRYRVLREHGRTCMLCGATREGGAEIHVDHIKPRSKYPHLELEFSNMQVLCGVCNLGKSNKFTDDFRGA